MLTFDLQNPLDLLYAFSERVSLSIYHQCNTNKKKPAEFGTTQDGSGPYDPGGQRAILHDPSSCGLVCKTGLVKRLQSILIKFDAKGQLCSERLTRMTCL